MHFYNGHFGGFHFIWWIIGLLIMGLIFYRGFGFNYQNSIQEDSLDILKRRFAKGKITREEFEESKRILNTNINH